jgi:CHAT domain-containing protein/tetratricopeptide (TPR) repeat protein
MRTAKSSELAILAVAISTLAGAACAAEQGTVAWQVRLQSCPLWPSTGALVILGDRDPRGILLDDQYLLLSESGRLTSLPGTDEPTWSGELQRREDGEVSLTLNRNGCKLTGRGTAHAMPAESATELERRADLMLAWTRIAEGERAASQGRFGEAQGTTSQGCDLLVKWTGEDAHHRATCSVRLSNRARDSGQFARALDLAETGARWFERTAGEGHVDTLSAHFAQAQALFSLAQHADALRVSQATSAARERLLGAANLETLAASNVAAISLLYMGRADEATVVLESIVSRMDEAGVADSLLAFKVRNNLALSLLQQGDAHRAVAVQELNWRLRAARLGASHPDSLISLRNYCNGLRIAGDEPRAMRLLEGALADFMSAFGAEGQETLRAQRLLALLYQRMERWNEAVALGSSVYLRMAASLGPSHADTLQALNNLAIAEMNAGRPDAAIARLREGLARWQEAHGPDHFNTRRARAALAFQLMRASRPQEALAIFQEGPDAAPLPPRGSGSVHPLRLKARAGMAQARFELGERERALAELRDILARKREQFGDAHPETMETLRALADFCDRSGRREEAIDLMEELVRRTEGSLTNGPLREYQRALVSARTGDDFQRASYSRLAVLLVASNPARAMEIAELAKMRALVDAVGAAIDPAPLEPQARMALKKLSTATAKAEETIANADPGSPAYVNAVAERVKLQDRVQELAREHEAPRDASRLRSDAMPEDVSFVSFLVSGDRVIAFVMRKDRPPRGHDLGRIPRLEDTVDAARRLLASPEPNRERVWRRMDGSFVFSIARPEFAASREPAPSTVLDELARRLIVPLLPSLGGTSHWVISPDGPLAFLPFEALRANRRTLIELADVSYAPSLTVVGLLRERASGREERAAQTIPFLGFAVSTFAQGPAREGVQRWKDLPRAEEEVREIARSFGTQPVRLFMGSDASDAAVRQLDRDGELLRARIVHLATHAYLSPRNAKLSALVFAPSAEGEGSHDGVVSAAELATLRLSAHLVVLSACETGVGQFVTGEGVIGLPYAIMTAGAQAAVLSLWQVVDESAAEFMVRFYRRLNEGMTPSKALRETKLELMRSKGPWSAPRHWAPFVLYGAP